MSKVDVLDPSGKKQGTVDLDDATFGLEPNIPVMNQVVNAQLAARRSGTQNTRTRAEVRGGGTKPWKQKGTGRARAGSIRAPHWRGGGVALGPKPRSYTQRTPKKMVRLALRSALSDRAAEGKVLVVDEWTWTTPRTKDALAALEALGASDRVLVVLGPEDGVAALAFRNLPRVQVIEAKELNAFDVLVNDWVIFTRETLPSGEAAAVTGAPAESDAETGEPEAAEVEASEPEAADEAEPADAAEETEESQS